MYQTRCDTSAASQAGLIEAWIIEGLAECKPVAQIAVEIAAQLQAASRPSAKAVQQ